MDKKTLRSADILTAIIMIGVGIWVSIYAIGLFQKSTGPFYTSSGIIPFLAGVLLILMSIGVLINGIREGGSLKVFKPAKIWKSLTGEAGLNTLFIYGWIAVYLFILMRVLPYILSTLIFLVVFTTRYYKKNYVVAIVVSVVVTILVTVMFGKVANIPLPGM